MEKLYNKIEKIEDKTTKLWTAKKTKIKTPQPIAMPQQQIRSIKNEALEKFNDAVRQKMFN